MVSKDEFGMCGYGSEESELNFTCGVMVGRGSGGLA